MMSCCYKYCLLGLLLLLSQVVTAQPVGSKQADSLIQAGISCQQKQDYVHAESFFRKAISICRNSKLKLQLGNALYNLATLYAVTENYETAIDLSEESRAIFQQFNDPEAVARCLMNIEHCQNQQGSFISAMVTSKQAVEVLRTTNNERLLELALWRCGELYKEVNTALAIPMFREALTLAERIPEYHNLDNIYSSLGFCYNDPYGSDYNPQLAEVYFLKALDAARKYDQQDVHSSRIHYGKICTTNKKYKKAEHNLLTVYSEAAFANDTSEMSVAAFCLSELYFGMGAYAKACDYLKKHETLEAVYYEGLQKGTLDKMAFNFKTDRIADENKLLKQQQALQKITIEQESFRKNVKIGIAVAVTLFLVVVTLLLLKYFRQKNALLSKKSDTLRQQLLLTQMSPHFIAGSINNIQTLIRADKPDTAAGYLSRFARLTRQILENSTGQYIPLEEEIAMASNYLAVQQLIHQEGFGFEIDADDIDSETILVPPMLTQPLLANAVKRLAHTSGRERSIAVRFRLKAAMLVVEVGDNGPALKPGEIRAILESADVKITAERLSNGRHAQGMIEIMDSVKEGRVSGVVARFEVPYAEDL